MSPRVKCILVLSCALAVSPPAMPAAEPRATDEVVVLPPLLVEEKAKPLEWRFLEMPGLEAISVCSDDVAMQFVRRLHRLNELLTVLVPERFWAQSSQPDAHILFNQEAGRARSQEIVAEMLKKSGARLSAGGVVAAGTGGDGGPFGRSRTIQFLPNMRLWDVDATVVFSILQDATGFTPTAAFGPERLSRQTANETSSVTLASDRVAFLLERRAPALPDWFVEGTLGLYETATLREDDVALSAARWLSDEDAAALLRDPEHPRALLPLQELLTRHRPKTRREGNEADRLWRAQCTLFVRWAIAKDDGVRREALWKFVDRLETEAPTEALFREHFGMGFADARDRLSDYLPSAVRTPLTLRGPKPKPLPRIRPRPATDLEVALLRGRWERLQIAYVRRRYPEVTEKYIEQARRTLHRAYDRDERNPRLLAELGFTEIDAENPAGARDFLEAAVRGGIVQPRAGFELARVYFEAMTAAAAPGTKLTAAQTRAALAPLEPGWREQPPLLESYVLMSDVWTRSAVPPAAEDLARLAEGVRLFPHASAYAMRAIYFHATYGQSATALALADTALRHARDDAARERLKLLRAELGALKK